MRDKRAEGPDDDDDDEEDDEEDEEEEDEASSIMGESEASDFLTKRLSMKEG